MIKSNTVKDSKKNTKVNNKSDKPNKQQDIKQDIKERNIKKQSIEKQREKQKPSIEEFAAYCKRKGFVFPTAEVYGGLAGFYDYGPLGVEVKNNIKQEWWRFHVHSRRDVVGIDGSIITNPRVWKASGHVDSFADIMLLCPKCKKALRADHYIEEKLGIKSEGLTIERIKQIIKKHNLKCSCGEGFIVQPFNLMFQTFIGALQDEASKSFLRPETAQLIFTNFKSIVEASRLKPPFGIAQIGKVFRNEISPRNFLFRCREFDQMEIEYFDINNKCGFFKEVSDMVVNLYPIHLQEHSKQHVKIRLSQAVNNKWLSQWLAYWIAKGIKWFISLGVNPENIRARQHLKQERAHYAVDTWDIEYKFPFGWKEVEGISDRAVFDLSQHERFTNKSFKIFDEQKGNILPRVVAEPSFGVDRAFLVFMYEAYSFDDKRNNIVLKLHPRLAAFKAAVFPLLANNKELVDKALMVYSQLKNYYSIFFDDSGSIGRRYARQDEIGTPYCITIDHQTLDDDTVTVRYRDSKLQERISIQNLLAFLNKKLRY